MATLDVPPTDFKGEKEECRKRKSRQMLTYVVIMALAGIAYLILGGIGGYYYGKSGKLKFIFHFLLNMAAYMYLIVHKKN